MTRRIDRSESGSALIMAVAFILAMGLAVTGLFTYLFAGQVAGTTVTEHGRELYALDTAAETTIARLRLDKALGVNGSSNCGLPSTESVDGYAVTVTCSADAFSRKPTTTTTGGSADGRRGIIALGSGVSFKNLSSTALEISGGIASRGEVRVENGDVAIEGQVAGSCVQANGGRLLAEPDRTTPVTCGPPAANDPGWTLPGPATPTITTASCPGGTVPSGTYKSAVIWHASIDVCSGGVSRFAGTYYLDLEDASGSCGMSTWCLTVGRKHLAGFDESTGKCAGGATFVLMDGTRMEVDGATAKFCGTAVAGDSVSVYAKTSAIGGGVVTTEIPLTPTVATRSTAGAMKYGDETGALTYGTPGIARLDHNQGGNAGTHTATLTVSGFPTVPAGATVKKTVLDIQHGEGTTAGSTATISVLLNGSEVGRISTGGACASTFCWRDITAGAPESTLTGDSIDLSGLLTTPASLSSATVTLKVDATAAAKGEVRSYIGGIRLRATYDAPAPPAGTPCVTPCTILETKNSNSDVTFFGAVYVPESHVKLHAVNTAVSTIAGGLVVSSLDVQTPASLASAENFHIGLTTATTSTPGPPTDGSVQLLFTLNGRRLSANVLLPEGSVPTGAVISNWTVK